MNLKSIFLNIRSLNPSYIVAILIGTLIASYASLYNTFPLFYSDSGTYIRSGWELKMPLDRPITYGLFIRYFAWGKSLWFVVIMQNLILSIIIRELCSLLLPNKRNELFYASLLLITSVTAFSWYSNQIMPDIFTPIFMMASFLFLFQPNYNRIQKFFLGLLIVISSSMHHSNLMIGLGLVIGLLLIRVIIKKKRKKDAVNLQLRKLIPGLALIMSAWIFIPFLHLVYDGKWRIAKASHVHLMASMCEKGILKAYLDDNCDDRDLKLCQFKDSLPDNIQSFIWEGDIISKTGGWEGSAKEYNQIIFETLTQPKYLWMHIKSSFLYGCSQLTQINVGEGLSAYEEGSPPYIALKMHHEKALPEYMTSKQNRWGGIGLQFEKETEVQWTFILVSLMISLIILGGKLWQRINLNSFLFLSFIIVCILSNAFVTGGLSSIYSRLNSRCIWLLILGAFVVLVSNWKLILGYLNLKKM